MTRDEVLAIINKAKRENALTLDLSYKSLTELPPEIGQLINLTELNLSTNKLQSLPIEIGQLSNLTKLNLQNNQLQSLPIQIGQLINLTKLDLALNQLQSLPIEIGQLSNLTQLILPGNQLQSLLVEIGQLSNLTELYLAGNQLQSLPVEIGQLSSLTGLYLIKNQLQSLPVEIGQLSNLTKLYLSDNQLQIIPVEIGQLSNLIVLDLRNNPINFLEKIHLTRQGDGVYVPVHAPQLADELLQKSITDIFNYLNNILNQENRPLNEAKLILVGEGAVGKTSLVNRLIADKYNEQEIKTEGINRQLWRLPVGEIEYKHGNSYKDIVRVNVWDFGGQEIMHATHQFFLTKRSVYLLVLDARRGEQESRLEYWLKLIDSFGGESPIIVVINKSDEHPLDLNTTFLQNKYPTIQAFCNISCKTAMGIDELKTIITEQISSLKDLKTPLPQTWFELKGALENLPDNYINYARYEQLCQHYQITEADSQKTLLSLLHDLGIILNFQDDDRFDRLKETNVLNPAWVTDGVYKILNNNALFQTQGKVTLQDLDAVLDKQQYPSRKEQQFIINMMEKFELCFRFDDTQFYLIPELLPKKEPYLLWDEPASLAFQYHYDVLPHSVISRFIVRMNQNISKDYWRTGVVLSYLNDNNHALIRADIEDKKIYIFVSGNPATRREFLAMIRGHFEHIHSTIKGLKVERKLVYKNVPLDYERFLMLEQKGIKEDLVESLNDMVNVKQLLAGYEENKDSNNPVTKINAKTVIYTNGGDANMSENKINDVGAGANVQQGVGGNATINEATKTDKPNIFENKIVLTVMGIFIVLILIVFSINSLCNNKIMSDKSCRILYQEIIVRVIPFINSEDKK